MILYGGIVFGILCAIIHGATTLSIRSLMRRVAPRSSSLSPMEGVVSQGGLLLTLWIIGGIVELVLAIFTIRSSLVRPRAITVWPGLLNPLTLAILIGRTSVFSTIGRSYIEPMSWNLAHIVFFLVLWWCLRGSRANTLYAVGP
jgi:hypothetical protein